MILRQAPSLQPAVAAPLNSAFLQSTGDKILHDLVGAAPNLLDTSVGPHARDRILEHVAVAAVQLNAIVDDLALFVGRPPFRHRSGFRIERSGDELLDAVFNEYARYGGHRL